MVILLTLIPSGCCSRQAMELLQSWKSWFLQVIFLSLQVFFLLRKEVCAFGLCSSEFFTLKYSAMCFGGNAVELCMKTRLCRAPYIPIQFGRTSYNRTLIFFWTSSLPSREELFPSPTLWLTFSHNLPWAPLKQQNIISGVIASSSPRLKMVFNLLTEQCTEHGA